MSVASALFGTPRCRTLHLAARMSSSLAAWGPKQSSDGCQASRFLKKIELCRPA